MKLGFGAIVEAFDFPIMKHISFSRIAAPFVLGALLMGHGPSASAQPGAPATPQMAPGGKQNGKMRGAQGKMGMQRRILTALEEKTGKPLSPEARERILESARVRDAATEAAQEKYLADFAAATGMGVDEARELHKTARRNPNAANGQGAGNVDKEARRAERKRLRQMNRGGVPEAPVAAPVAQ